MMPEAGPAKGEFLEDVAARLNTDVKGTNLRMGRIGYHEEKHQNSPIIPGG